MIDREWTVVGQVIVNAPDQATAQAAVEAAVAAAQAAMAALDGPQVAIQLETENGQYVFSL